MTTIRRLYFQPSDILAIQMECRKCGTTISCRLKDWTPVAAVCPSCLVPLIKDDKLELSTLRDLAATLNTLLTLGDRLAYQVRFEFDEK